MFRSGTRSTEGEPTAARSSRTTMLLALGAVVLLSGVGLGMTLAPTRTGAREASPDPSAGPPDPAAAPEWAHPRPGPFLGVVHGELELTRFDGSTFAVVLDRGMIESRTADEITFLRPDGQRVTVEVHEDTIVREGLAFSTVDALTVGDRAMVVSEPEEDGSLRALVIRCVTHPRPRVHEEAPAVA